MNDSSSPSAVRVSTWPLVITAAAIMTITMGARQSLGLFVSPLNSATGLGIVAISFAMAVGQFVWGASQPIFGAVADRYGSARVVMAGGVLLAKAAGVQFCPRTYARRDGTSYEEELHKRRSSRRCFGCGRRGRGQSCDA